MITTIIKKNNNNNCYTGPTTSAATFTPSLIRQNTRNHIVSSMYDAVYLPSYYSYLFLVYVPL